MSEDAGPDAERTAPPPRDLKAVASVAGRVRFVSLDLVGGQFSTEGEESALLTAEGVENEQPRFGLDVSWGLADDGSRLGCVFTLATIFDPGGIAPYEVMGRFRAVYAVREGPRLDDRAVEQFVYWNAFFHVWPYWREYFSALLMRSWVPKHIAPVIPIPGGQAD